MGEFEQDIENNQTILFVFTKERYAELRKEIILSVKGNFSRLCYITTNKPYQSVVEELESQNMQPDNMFFIDTITKTVQEPTPSDKCIFIDAPTSLTDISLAFSDALNEKQCDGCLFDTISTLAIYQDSNSVVKLVHNLVTKTRVSGKKAIFIALREDGEEFISDISMFVDKVIRSG